MILSPHRRLRIRASSTSKEYTLAGVLLLAMIATRYYHFGSALHLPDASLAVFFLGGFRLRRWVWFPLFLATAGAVDTLAINLGGVSSWCVTPAYLFLIPAYACLWWGGAGTAAREIAGATPVGLAAGLLLASTSAAFLISNAGFYLLSGYFDGMSAADYAVRVSRYFAPYIGSAFLYVGIALAVRAGWRMLRGLGASGRAPGA